VHEMCTLEVIGDDPDPDTDPDSDRYPVIKHIDRGMCCLSPSRFHFIWSNDCLSDYRTNNTLNYDNTYNKGQLDACGSISAIFLFPLNLFY